jgi:competence protein ComEA
MQPALNINNASIEQLEKVKGIGARKAQAIVEYRLLHGNFTQIDDITKVKGIGSSFLEKNRAWLSVE